MGFLGFGRRRKQSAVVNLEPNAEGEAEEAAKTVNECQEDDSRESADEGMGQPNISEEMDPGMISSSAEFEPTGSLFSSAEFDASRSPAPVSASASGVSGDQPNHCLRRKAVSAEKASEASSLLWALTAAPAEGRPNAAAAMAKLAKADGDARRALAEAGAVEPLLDMLAVSNPAAVEAALRALAALSLDDEVRWDLSGERVLSPLIQLAKSPTRNIHEAAVALLASLSYVDENKRLIGSLGGIPVLVQVFGQGSGAAKEEALACIRNLSVFSPNKALLLQHRTVKEILRLVSFAPSHKLADVGLLVVRNLATRDEGREAIVAFKGIACLTKVLERGSDKGKEEALSLLLVLSTRNPVHRGTIWEAGIIPHLRSLALCNSSSSRAREKAEALLKEMQEHCAAYRRR